jgi:hypothetical protein
MTDTESTDKVSLGRQKERKVSPVLLSLIIASILGLAAGFFVHMKNEKMKKTETNIQDKDSNHAN